MGGQQGTRGYLYQAVVSIFSACAENNWDQISVEYTTPKDKVDIALMSETGDVLKAIQVKSSVNLFAKNDILTWISEIMNDVNSKEYQLILIGNCQEPANKLIKSIDKLYNNAHLDSEATQSLGSFRQRLQGKNVRVLLLPFDVDQLMGVIRDSLNRFISLQGYTIDYSVLEQICYALITLYMFLGTNGKAISKADYEKRIIEWLISSANGGMKQNGNYSELTVKVVSQGDNSLANIGASILLKENNPLCEYRNSILSSGTVLIRQIENIKLPAFEHLRAVKPCDPEKVRKYVKGDLSNFRFDAFPKFVRSELSDIEKSETKAAIQQYWNIAVQDDFFYVGNLSESTLFSSITGKVDYNGTEIEKQKNHMIHDLRWKALIMEAIDNLTEILSKVHLLPLCGY